jgi:hypothetical protein
MPDVCKIAHLLGGDCQIPPLTAGFGNPAQAEQIGGQCLIRINLRLLL